MDPGVYYSQKSFIAADKRMIHLAMPTRGIITTNIAMFLFQSSSWVIRSGCSTVGLWLAHGMPVGQARENIALQIREFTKSAPDHEHWVLWCDDDMDPPQNAAGVLLSCLRMHPQIGIVSAYCARKESNDPGILYHPDDGTQMIPGIDYEPGKLVHVMHGGLGFAMHSAELFDQIEPPYFSTNGDGSGEDIAFTQKAAHAGRPLYINTGFIVGHVNVKTGVNFTPYIVPEISAAPKAQAQRGTIEHGSIKVDIRNKVALDTPDVPSSNGQVVPA